MNIFDIMFYLFAAITVGSAFCVVTTKNIVHAAFYLLFTLIGIAGLYVLLGADFVGIVQLIVYVGGILVLILFGVMLTNKITNVKVKTGTLQLLPATIGIGLLAGTLITLVFNTHWAVRLNEVKPTTLSALGELLLNQYSIAFELLGVILLIALVGAASIARK